MTQLSRGDAADDDVLRSVFGDVDLDFAALVEAEIRRLSRRGPRSVRPAHQLDDRGHEQFLQTRTPVDPWTPSAYVRQTLAEVIDGSVRSDSPVCLSNMTTVLPSAMPSLAALVTTLNQNLVKAEASQALSRCERQVLGMLHRLAYRRSEDFYRDTVQAPDATLGLVTTGGSLANLAALWVARNSVLPQARQLGLVQALNRRGAAGACVVGPASMHYSFAKAADILGIGAGAGLRRVPLDRRGRMDPRALRATLDRARADGWIILAVVAVAGTTDAGAVDPLADAADAAADVGAPLHVDAAWGAPICFSRRHRHLLDGLDRADTVTVDGHKQLHAPTGVAAVLFRDPRRADVIEHTADYAVREGSPDLGRRSVEGSRPGSVLLLHAALHLLGERGYQQAVDGSLRLAEQMAEEVRRRPELELLVEPELNIVLYRYLPPASRGRAAGSHSEAEDVAIDAVNTALHERERAVGSCQVSRTRWDLGDEARPRRVVALRAVLANPATSRADIRAVLAAQVRWGDEIAGEVVRRPFLDVPGAAGGV